MLPIIIFFSCIISAAWSMFCCGKIKKEEETTYTEVLLYVSAQNKLIANLFGNGLGNLLGKGRDIVR